MTAEHKDAEARRLQALYDYDVLDTGPEEAFDRITRLAKLVMNTPVARISFVDKDREWFKSRIGTEISNSARRSSFCSRTIEDDGALVVTDAREDPHFRDSPLVKGRDGVRFYAGVSLRTPDGFNVGSLCVTDTVPRSVSPAQLAALADLARLVVDQLELRKLACVDVLTGLLTRRAFFLQFRQHLAESQRLGRQECCILLDLDYFKQVNDRFGHTAGDLILQRVAAVLKEDLRQMDVVGRIGGEEFAILLPDLTIDAAVAIAERLRQRIAKPLPYGASVLHVTGSFGITPLTPSDATIQVILERVDRALYLAKETKNCTVVVPAEPPLGVVPFPIAM